MRASGPVAAPLPPRSDLIAASPRRRELVALLLRRRGSAPTPIVASAAPPTGPEGDRVSRGTGIDTRIAREDIDRANGKTFAPLAGTAATPGGGFTAHHAGADVIMLERGTYAGGTTFKSGSEYWTPNNSFMRAKGLSDPKDWALKYMVRLSYPQLYDPESPTLGAPQLGYDLISTFYDTASVAVDAFQQWGALYSRIQPSFGYSAHPDLADPDYHADLPEDKAPYGRGLNPDPKKGSSVLTVQMQKWTDAHGVPLLLEHRVVGLFRNRTGQVVGVQVDNNGKQLAMRAKKAVVFGSGG